MKIVLTGGGSGGHITPILAIAAELKQLRPDVKVIYIGQKGDGLIDIPTKDKNINEVYTIRAGKFRRYNSEGIKQLLDLKTAYLNIRDLFYITIGFFQSLKLTSRIKPDVVFSKGGYVGVPVCLAAKIRHIPYTTHDSDSIPGLANRLIAKWATLHFVALPKNIYSYPQDKTLTTGIPLNKAFIPVNSNIKKAYRQKLDIGKDKKMLLVIGGGLGAQSLNEAVLAILTNLFAEIPDLYVAHIVGRNNYQKMQRLYAETLPANQLDRIKILDYTTEVYLYSGAADLIVTRAGATNLAEFAVQGKACIVVPSSYLTGGHQLKNAEILAEDHAAEVITDVELEEDHNRLAQKVRRLIKDPKELASLSSSLSHLAAKPRAGEEIATKLLELAEK